MRGRTRRSPVLAQRAGARLSGSSGTLPATFDVSTALPYIVRMFTVIETPTFVRLASNCWNDEDRTNFITFIAANPDAGDVVPGSGSLRKVRWGTAGRGKRGGVRVIYFNRLANGEIWLLLVYGKSMRENIPAHVLRQIKKEIENA